ncbi:adenine phosphoribosyltransferase [Sanyastnella coralliicola]|uniref:adenine phosphoribosyltransferase n=1 Tax=Sanyastnella coralliicola TaxID=3069118 RepID=UPI0027BAD2D0|nr:adenine phosphoribosyltransferase [Longitalea sp. SCSIO 12813]
MIEERIHQTVRTVPDFPKPGIQFKDISTLCLDPKLAGDIVDELAARSPEGVSAVVGIESRGFLFGVPLAIKLGVPFVLLRKAGKLPAETIAYSYDLEYGQATIEMHKDAIQAGDKVLVHDDLLATGGTALAAAELVKQQGGEVAGFSFLMSIDVLDGEEAIRKQCQNIAILARS